MIDVNREETKMPSVNKNAQRDRQRERQTDRVSRRVGEVINKTDGEERALDEKMVE